MKNALGIGLAVLATASFAFASGDDEKKDKAGKTSPKSEPTPLVQGWSGDAGKGLTYSSDLFGLNLRNSVQVSLDFINVDTGPDTLNFNLRRARTHLSGHIWNKNITFHLSNEWSSDAEPVVVGAPAFGGGVASPNSVKDAYIGWVFHSTEAYNLGLTMGQMKTRFGNEWNTRYDELEFINRSVATRVFSGERSRGAMLHGDLLKNNLGWSVAAHNTDVAAASANAGEEGGTVDNSDNKLNYNIEVHWSSNANAPKLGGGQGDLAAGGKVGFLVGAAYNIGNAIAAVGPAVDVDTGSANVFARVDTGNGLSFAAEYFLRSESPTGGTDVDHSGYQVSGSWVAPSTGGGNRWGAGIRYSAVEFDDGAASPLMPVPAGIEVNEIDFVVNMFYHEHAMKTQVGVTLQNVDTTFGGGTDLDHVLFSIQTTATF